VAFVLEDQQNAKKWRVSTLFNHPFETKENLSRGSSWLTANTKTEVKGSVRLEGFINQAKEHGLVDSKCMN
jgi:hypothetical protein